MPGLVGANAASLLANASGWQSRVSRGAYVSPSGKRIEYATEGVAREMDIRGTVFAFPQYGGDYVQRTGISSRRYPVQAIFHGARCDIEAASFEAALSEPGTGKLEHPFYGTFEVIPFGAVARRDDLVLAGNQSIVDVVFWSTIGAIYPGVQRTGESEIDAWLERFGNAAVNGFGSVVDVSSVAKQVGLATSLKRMIGELGNAFDDISSVIGDVRSGFAEAASVVNAAVDVLVGKPLLLARQVVDLMQAPGRAVAGVLDRLDGYGRMLDSIVDSDAGNPTLALVNGAVMDQTRARVGNAFHAADMTAMSGVSGSVLTARSARTELRTKPEALAAAERIEAQLATLTAWRDAGHAALLDVPVAGQYQIDLGDSYRELRGAVAVAVRYLVELSFSLAQERVVVLGSDRNFIELASELYGRVDDKTLDLLIESNSLTADEIISIPRGRSIVYYP